MNKTLKYVFNISVIFLIIISLWPGSLAGYLFYGDFGKQPDFIESSPRSGPTVLSSIIVRGAGKAPDLSSKARSVAD